jgi:hypothetical protein
MGKHRTEATKVDCSCSGLDRGKGDRYIARWLTLSSITLEGARLVKKFWFNRPKVDRTPAKSREVPQ